MAQHQSANVIVNVLEGLLLKHCNDSIPKIVESLNDTSACNVLKAL